MAKGPIKKGVANPDRVGTIDARNESNDSDDVLQPGEDYPDYGEVVATDEAPYHKPGEVVTAHPAVIHRMVKRGWAKPTKQE